MTTAILTLGKVQRNTKSTIKAIELPTINWKAICYVGSAITFLLLVFYVLQINSLTRGSYLISSYQKQINQLSQENRNLQVSFAESSFMGQALQKVQALNFQKVNPSSIIYVQMIDSSTQVAKANNNI